MDWRTDLGAEGIAREIVDAAFVIRREVGAGLLESVYQAGLADEVRQRGIFVEEQVAVPCVVRGRRIAVGFRADMIAGGKVLVELKAARSIDDIHVAQTLTYLRLSGCHIALLINFNSPLLKDGIRRFVA